MRFCPTQVFVTRLRANKNFPAPLRGAGVTPLAFTFASRPIHCYDKNMNKIKTIDELRGLFLLDMADLSDLDLQGTGNLFDGPMTWNDQANVVGAWTDRVIWPSANKLPDSFDPVALLENAKAPTLDVAALHAKGITGKNIGIAIIDTMLNADHPDYKNRIKVNELISGNYVPAPEYHGSLVVGNAAGKTTGTAPDADVYFFSATSKKNADGKGWNQTDKNKAIRRILEINNNLPTGQKIRFLSCSFGDPNDELADERHALFETAEQNGIMVLGGFYKHTMQNSYHDTRYANTSDHFSDERLSMPTDGKTTPFYKGGFIFSRLGGMSSTFPYLAGIFALALQNNPEFAAQNGWQDRMMQIAKNTATKTKTRTIINPTAIVAEVDKQTKLLRLQYLHQQQRRGG